MPSAKSAFLVYREFMHQHDALRMAEWFSDRNIECYVQDETPTFDPSFAFSELSKRFTIRLKPVDFQRADQALEEVADRDSSELDADHYLRTFSQSELLHVVENPRDWSPIDVAHARRLLRVKVSPDDAKKVVTQKEPEVHTAISVLHWIKLIALSFFSGLIALYISWNMYFSERVNAKGDVVKIYSPTNRKRLVILIIWSGLVFLVTLLVAAGMKFRH